MCQLRFCYALSTCYSLSPFGPESPSEAANPSAWQSQTPILLPFCNETFLPFAWERHALPSCRPCRAVCASVSRPGPAPVPHTSLPLPPFLFLAPSIVLQFSPRFDGVAGVSPAPRLPCRSVFQPLVAASLVLLCPAEREALCMLSTHVFLKQAFPVLVSAARAKTAVLPPLTDSPSSSFPEQPQDALAADQEIATSSRRPHQQRHFSYHFSSFSSRPALIILACHHR